jgi:hypothetical protein
MNHLRLWNNQLNLLSGDQQLKELNHHQWKEDQQLDLLQLLVLDLSPDLSKHFLHCNNSQNLLSSQLNPQSDHVLLLSLDQLKYLKISQKLLLKEDQLHLVRDQLPPQLSVLLLDLSKLSLLKKLKNLLKLQSRDHLFDQYQLFLQLKDHHLHHYDLVPFKLYLQ